MLRALYTLIPKEIMGNRMQERVDIKLLQTEVGSNAKRLPMVPAAQAIIKGTAVRSSRWLILV